MSGCERDGNAKYSRVMFRWVYLHDIATRMYAHTDTEHRGGPVNEMMQGKLR